MSRSSSSIPNRGECPIADLNRHMLMKNEQRERERSSSE